jgi:hypothetical protein
MLNLLNTTPLEEMRSVLTLSRPSYLAKKSCEEQQRVMLLRAAAYAAQEEPTLSRGASLAAGAVASLGLHVWCCAQARS